jgi:large subunit ribosomal protein L13
MSTVMPKEAEIDRKWFLVDADGKVLGRLATSVARVARQAATTFAPPDVGDHVVVINAEKVHLRGAAHGQDVPARRIGGLRKIGGAKETTRAGDQTAIQGCRPQLPGHGPQAQGLQRI